MNFECLVNLILEDLKKPKIYNSFIDLPDNPPYGFIVFPDGKYAVARSAYDHNFILKELGTDMFNFLKTGGIRVVKKDATAYYIDGLTQLSKARKAISTSKDIAIFYDMASIEASKEGRGAFLPSYYEKYDNKEA